jgi:hypothetical protein
MIKFNTEKKEHCPKIIVKFIKTYYEMKKYDDLFKAYSIYALELTNKLKRFGE